VQYGWNAGPRHARVFGLVRNIKKTLTGEDREECDRKILGVFALSWNLLTAALPKEVIEPTYAAIAAVKLPVMASQGDVKGLYYPMVYLTIPTDLWKTLDINWTSLGVL